MEYKSLGNSGLKISKVILGCMGYGTPEWEGWVLDEEASLPLLEYAYKSGIRTWDTADAYASSHFSPTNHPRCASHGRSEEIIGKAIKKYQIPRERLVILTKCFFGVTPHKMANTWVYNNDGEELNQVGLSRKHIIDAVDKSVARLGTYIDVLQIHRLDQTVPREEIMRALNDVVESGKVRYIGASSMAAWEFQGLQNVAEKHGWHKFISMQNYHNLLYREEENEMIPYCNHTGVGVIPWSSVARGALTRPWDDRSSSREQTDGGLKHMVRSADDKADREVVGRVEEVAKKLKKSMAQVAIAWSLSKGVNPIVGMNKMERMDEALEASKMKLSEKDIKFLEEPYLPKKRQGY
ncbi:alcohol dehydrogenase [Cladophialophora yegresii CBS 114405]|uniref:Alcohol dehydrogenase n=1 Tax=Cladophialophora yegresii CBS 114405 TaxID=1182544 RepID=W9VQ01_9EURO|nr:alcohol dehydrogenase [Cladophialophora yegresii CBS 114405]EXJ54216.1 alcohol dehydrogenase [Cladophialophora yegresii CBS 114405]